MPPPETSSHGPGDTPGPLFVIGGAEDKLRRREVLTRFVECVGGADARIAVVPTASSLGPEVVDEFRAAFGDVPNMVVKGPNKDHIDLRVATRALLEKVGVLPSHIDDTPQCTRCNEQFFSYRRDGKDGGVHMAFIAMASSG